MQNDDLKPLQQQFAFIDMLAKKPKNSRSDLLEALLIKHQQMKLKMYQEPGHARPHFHVDYGADNHIASYAIDTGDRLDGNLPRKYDKAVSAWARGNQASLLSTWQDLQAGGTGATVIASLPGMK